MERNKWIIVNEANIFVSSIEMAPNEIMVVEWEHEIDFYEVLSHEDIKYFDGNNFRANRREVFRFMIIQK